MKEKSQNRYFVFAVVFALLFGLLIVNLYRLSIQDPTLIRGKIEKEVVLKGTRGRILFSNNQPLAFSQKSYDVIFLRDDQSKSAEIYRSLYTESMIKTIELVEKNGFKTVDTFAIRKRPNGDFFFDWGDVSQKAAAQRFNAWCDFMHLSGKQKTEATPEEIYYYLRKKFYIPEEYTFDQSLKLLSIWQEVQRNSYRAYLPVIVAPNVTMPTVAQIETRSAELIGVGIAEGSVRIYPKGKTAAHSVGYLGRINNADDFKTKYEPIGYVPDDTIGVAGIESTFEEHLTQNTDSRKGKRILEVSSKGVVNRVVSVEAPRNGNDVVLTLDMGMQQVAENAIEDNINKIHSMQQEILQDLERSKRYADIKKIEDIRLAKYGSVVVLDAKTGAVLSLASYPSFDANVFTNGLSKIDAQALFEKDAQGNDLPEKQRKYLMINKAIALPSAPGSIFKMVTGLGALQEGAITVNTRIDDLGKYTKYTQGKTENAPGCWNKNPHEHANQDIVAAIQNSCNYYFYTAADELGIDHLETWAANLGLDTKTGIELPGERAGQIGGQKTLFDNTKPLLNQKLPGIARLVRDSIIEELRAFTVAQSKETTQEKLEACANRLLTLVDSEERIGSQIRMVLREELGIPEAVSQERGWYARISSMLTELRWNPNQTIRTGIGQAVLSITPIEAARYVAALVNGGKVYDTHIVDKVVDPQTGEIVFKTKPKLIRTLDVEPLYLQKIKEGMRNVVSPEDRGTASNQFEDFKEYVDSMGGKTGTAQVSRESRNIDLENTSYFVAFAPYDDPEIVIVVCIPNGLSGSLSAPTVKAIVKYYMDQKNVQSKQNVSKIDSLVQ